MKRQMLILGSVIGLVVLLTGGGFLNWGIAKVWAATASQNEEEDRPIYEILEEERIETERAEKEELKKSLQQVRRVKEEPQEVPEESPPEEKPASPVPRPGKKVIPSRVEKPVEITTTLPSKPDAVDPSRVAAFVSAPPSAASFSRPAAESSLLVSVSLDDCFPEVSTSTPLSRRRLAASAASWAKSCNFFADPALIASISLSSLSSNLARDSFNSLSRAATSSTVRSSGIFGSNIRSAFSEAAAAEATFDGECRL